MQIWGLRGVPDIHMYNNGPDSACFVVSAMLQRHLTCLSSSFIFKHPYSNGQAVSPALLFDALSILFVGLLRAVSRIWLVLGSPFSNQSILFATFSKTTKLLYDLEFHLLICRVAAKRVLCSAVPATAARTPRAPPHLA